MDAIMDQNKCESETLAYKMFMKVAKKLKYLEYGKWNIVPDTIDPLRKFTIERTIDWGKIRLMLYPYQYHKRKYDYNNYSSAYAWRYMIGVQGLFANANGELVCKTGVLLKPRMAKKLLTFINEKLIPNFYEEIENTRMEREEKLITDRILKQNIDIVKDYLKVEVDRYTSHRYRGNSIKNWLGVSSHSIILDKENVCLDLTTDYTTAKKILAVLHNG